MQGQSGLGIKGVQGSIKECQYLYSQSIFDAVLGKEQLECREENHCYDTFECDLIVELTF